MPSNTSPSARRCHCSRPHGWDATRRSARSRTSGPAAAPGTGNQRPGRSSAVRALVGHRELAQPLDLVAPQVDAHRDVGGGGEDVDDRAAHRELAPVLDLVLAPIALSPVARSARWSRPGRRASTTGSSVLDVGAETLHERPCGRHDHRQRLVAVAQPPHRAQAPTHRLDRGADPLEGQRLPCREQLDASAGRNGPGLPRDVRRRARSASRRPPAAAGQRHEPRRRTACAASGTTSTVEELPRAPTRPGSSRSIDASRERGRRRAARRGNGAGDGLGVGSVTHGTYPGPPTRITVESATGREVRRLRPWPSCSPRCRRPRSASATSSVGSPLAGSRPATTSPPRSSAWCRGPRGCVFGGRRRGPTWSLGCVGRPGGCVGLILFYWAMSQGPMSVVAPVSAVMSAMVPVTSGLLAGERPPLAILGIALALPAILPISREPTRDRGARPGPPSSALAARAPAAASLTASAGPRCAAALAGVGFGLFFVFLAGPPTTAACGRSSPPAALRSSLAILAVVVTGRGPRRRTVGGRAPGGAGRNPGRGRQRVLPVRLAPGAAEPRRGHRRHVPGLDGRARHGWCCTSGWPVTRWSGWGSRRSRSASSPRRDGRRTGHRDWLNCCIAASIPSAAIMLDRVGGELDRRCPAPRAGRRGPWTAPSRRRVRARRAAGPHRCGPVRSPGCAGAG